MNRLSTSLKLVHRNEDRRNYLCVFPIHVMYNTYGKTKPKPQGSDTQALTVGRSATTVYVKGQGHQNRAKSVVKDKSFQPTIEKYLNIVAKSPVKDRKRLLVIGQSEISAGQDFDHSCRSTYSAYLRDTH